jgi:hypothetical protein
MLELGLTYTRGEIQSRIGGSRRTCFVQVGDRLVGICFRPDMNPYGPATIFLRAGSKDVRAAQLSTFQPDGVPVFARRRSGAWEYLGLFKAERYIASREKIQHHMKRHIRHEIVGALFLDPS